MAGDNLLIVAILADSAKGR